MKKPLSPHFRKGFTLIELMVAMAIALIIMGMLIGITNVAMGTWQRSRAEVRASRQAKTMLDVMAKDLESMVIRSGNRFEWLYAAVEPTLPGTAADRSTNAAEFIFFSAATDRYRGGAGTPADLGGDVCAVSYKLAYQDPLMATATNPNDSTFVFYRQLMDPRPTFDNMLGRLDLRAAFAGTPGNSRFETQANAGTVVANDSRYSFVCENVYQYSVTFRVDVTTTVGTVTTVRPVRVSMGNQSPARFLRLYGNRLDTDAVVSGGGMAATNAELRTGRVTGVEISITVLSDSGLAQLKTRTFANPIDRAKFLAKNSFEFSKSVDVPGL